jgi:fengycin family lipopeptide synthetase B
MKNLLRNKICLLTGATGGLGKEIIRSLIFENIKIIIIGKSKKKLKDLKSKYNKININIIDSYDCDFSNQNNIKTTIENILKKKYSIDILINCAGDFNTKELSKVRYDEIIALNNINFIAPIFFIKAFTKLMKRKKWGRIVNIGSSSSYAGFKNSTVYCATKHALLGLSRSVNEELKEFGIRSYTISPGSIQTEMGKLVKNQSYSNFIDPAELSDFIVNIIKQDGNMITEEIKVNRIKYK